MGREYSKHACATYDARTKQDALTHMMDLFMPTAKRETKVQTLVPIGQREAMDEGA